MGAPHMATANYWLSFMVATERSAAKGVESLRRQSIYAAVQVFDSGYWDETTSFILFEADDCGSAWKGDPVSGVIGVE